ncbi:Olfactory Receptor 2Ag1 [Manis pentadactyla]|nr:Olfactory Receptor 2Ag1 [Manis pentadactyla]
MQKSGDRSNVAGEVFMEKDRIEFTLEPMRFWFVEKKRGAWLRVATAAATPVISSKLRVSEMFSLSGEPIARIQL